MIVILFSVFIITNVTAQTHKLYTPGTDTLYTKKQLIVRNSAKDTIEIADFKNGKKHGKQTLFTSKHILKQISEYKHGWLNGEVTYFATRTKQPTKIEHYKAFPNDSVSLLHGTVKVFDGSGKLSELTTYKKGKREGKYENYYNNGQLKEKATYKEDLLTGNRRLYSNKGALVKDENYVIITNPDYIKANTPKADNGNAKSLDISKIPEKIAVLHGDVAYYFSNGLRSAELHFKYGKKEGVCKEYYNTSKNVLKSEVVFKNGLEHGAYTYYDSNGTMARSGIFYKEIMVNDSLFKSVYDGVNINYQDNGQRQRLETWKNFKKNGVSESYHSKTGELSARTFYEDNLKVGVENRFDKEGNKTYEAFFEIVTVDGHKKSVQTGTETYWEHNKVKTTVNWKNGEKDGVCKMYYNSGELERVMHFKEGKLAGAYQTYFENGQLKEDYHKKHWAGTGNPENIDWNILYDESGAIVRKFYVGERAKTIIESRFEHTHKTEFEVTDAFRINYNTDYQMSGVAILRNSRPSLGYNLFSNQQLRRVQFVVGNDFITANYTSEGKVNQLVSATGKHIDDPELIKMAAKIGTQYNAEWEQEKLTTEAFPEGKYRWNYADGSPFFEIEFTDDLPEGTWIAYNPVQKDTLFYAQYHKGLPVGNWVRKRMDGTIELRETYFDNNQLKESYRYDGNGVIANVTKNDSLGKRIFQEEYYDGGILKNRDSYIDKSYLHMDITGDTLSYDITVMREKDSVRISKRFYQHNQIKNDKEYNLSKGIGYQKYYFETGQLQISQQLKADKQHGLYQKFDENGKLLITGYFKEGNRDGEWVTYTTDGKEEHSYFEDGKLALEKMQDMQSDDEVCKCYDTSLPSKKIGFANSLAYLADYKTISPYIPKSIIPVNNWNYDKIFFVNFISNNNSTYGSTQFKLLFFNDFEFQYPAENFLTININPCKTDGHIGNVEANVSYDFENKKLVSSYFHTKRISVGLTQNPLVNATNKGIFTAYFDTAAMQFNEDGISEIQYSKEVNPCFPPGIINDFMAIQIHMATLQIDPKNRYRTSGIPLLGNEYNQLYGFEITDATVSFKIGDTLLTASSKKMVAGAHYVAGTIMVQGVKQSDEVFKVAESNTVLEVNHLTKILEQHGFYRVKTTLTDDQLAIQFYAEK